MTRSYSEKFVPGMTDFDLFKNRNVDWLSGRFTKVAYIIFVFITWGLIHISTIFPSTEAWTITNIIHGVVTFVLFHWIKGCPDDSTQGEYNGLTVYEQIDCGVAWTQTKKMLMLMPAFLTWMACHTAHYEPIFVVVNGGMFLICIIAKIPEMHRVRLFGINSTPGIDEPVESLPMKTRKAKAQ